MNNVGIIINLVAIAGVLLFLFYLNRSIIKNQKKFEQDMIRVWNNMNHDNRNNFSDKISILENNIKKIDITDVEIKVQKLYDILIEKTPMGKEKLSKSGKRVSFLLKK